MSSEQPPETRGRHSRPHPRLARALLLTVASTIVPGTAHLSRRRYRAAALLLTFFAVVVALIVLAATRERAQLLSLALDPTWLLGILIGAVVVALLWCANVVWSYRAVRPLRLSGGRKAVAAVTVTALCALVCMPLGLAANYAQASRGLVTDIFPDATTSAQDDDADPWGPKERLNVLLIGGDADQSRRGVRTDVMMVASIDPQTGNTVLLSVPRNLQNAPMPFPALRQRFPTGFPKFLYGVWRYGARHPQLVPGTTQPGAHLLTETMQEILGIPVDYYALVDLDGFKSLINALGGVWLDVQRPIPYGENGQFVVKPGYRPLTGREALWYARSRTGSSDYARMRRQRCMIAALTKQADPMTVLRNFRDLADAAKRTVSTSIPRDLLPELVELVPEVRQGKIANVQLVPPLINTGDPNYAKIHRVVKRTINQAGDSADDGSARQSKPPAKAKGPGGKTPAASPGARGDSPVSPGRPDQGGPQRGTGDKPDAGAGPQRDEAARPGSGQQGQPGQQGQQGQPGKPGQREPQQPSEKASNAKPVSLQSVCPRTDAPG